MSFGAYVGPVPHFVRSWIAFTCTECLELSPAESLMLVTERRSENGGMKIPARLCERCGRVIVESWDRRPDGLAN
jgi:hypothetical protein